MKAKVDENAKKAAEGKSDEAIMLLQKDVAIASAKLREAETAVTTANKRCSEQDSALSALTHKVTMHLHVHTRMHTCTTHSRYKRTCTMRVVHTYILTYVRTDEQTDRETDRETDSQTQIDRQIDRQTDIHIYIPFWRVCIMDCSSLVFSCVVVVLLHSVLSFAVCLSLYFSNFGCDSNSSGFA